MIKWGQKQTAFDMHQYICISVIYWRATGDGKNKQQFQHKKITLQNKNCAIKRGLEQKIAL